MEQSVVGSSRTEQVGLGVDIVEIERMKTVLARTPSFAQRVFSDEERAYCEAKPAPEIHYATRFAAKEAVLKALGTGFTQGIRPCDVEVRRTTKGRPYAVLYGAAKAIARNKGVRELPISLSYTHTEAVACAMALTEDSARVAQEQRDPMADLTKRFKELRSMLDDAPMSGTVASQDRCAQDRCASHDETLQAGTEDEIIECKLSGREFKE